MGKFKIGDKFYEAPSYKLAVEMAKNGSPAAPVSIGAPKPVGGPAPIAVPAPITAPAPIAAPGLVGALPIINLPPAAAAGAADGEIKVIHRADSRDLDHSSITRDKGFACQNGQWCIREVACARAFVKKLLDPAYDTSKIAGFAFANEILTPVKNVKVEAIKNQKLMARVDLNNVMAFIKRVLKDTRAFWVSTSLNLECGGYATKSEYNLYRFTLPTTLKQYELVFGDTVNTLKPVGSRTGDMVPTICFNGAALDGSDSTIVAINSGPVSDCEISFLTRIPLTWVETLRKKT